MTGAGWTIVAEGGAGVLISGGLWLVRRIVGMVHDMGKVASDIRAFSQQWEDAVGVRDEVARNTRDITRILGALGVPEVSDEQVPLIPYVHDEMHELRSLMTKLAMSVEVSLHAAGRIERAAARVEDSGSS